MKPLLDSPSNGHREIIDARLASYRTGKSEVISMAELMRRVRAEPNKNEVARANQARGLKANFRGDFGK